MYIYWILLGLAIATEITGTLSMKWASVSEGNGGFILMLVMISLSYIFLSFAVKNRLRRSLCVVGRYRYFIYYLVQRFVIRRKFIADENCRVNHPGRRDCVDKIRYP